MRDEVKYTRKEYQEFRRLVMLNESQRQMDRIEGRLEMRKFIDKPGQAKCDAMFEELKLEDAIR